VWSTKKLEVLKTSLEYRLGQAR